MKVLFASSEVFPLVKTGGLADVAYALPRALAKQGADVRIVMPAYREVLSNIERFRVIGWCHLPGDNRTQTVRILDAGSDVLGVPLILIDAPDLFDRVGGGPYQRQDGSNWPDNAERFSVFSRAVAELACGRVDGRWLPDTVHCNDWQSGLVCAFLSLEMDVPKSVFTIHNLAYGGHFGHDDFIRLNMPGQWWGAHGVEFYHNFSMLKAGIVFSDVLTTVSPNYAHEITTPAFGCGYDGLLTENADKLIGILNGIDEDIWNPQIDTLIAKQYSRRNFVSGKKANKIALLEQFGLDAKPASLKRPLLGFVGRLADQKGVDLILAALPKLIDNTEANFVFVGSGQASLQEALTALAEKHPKRIGIYLGYSESAAHAIEAGCDLFLMPSRFEPCGLNQLYSLAYGTLPVVHKVGGLADTVVHTTNKTLENKTATGFVFSQLTLDAFYACILQALEIYQSPTIWRQIVRQAMQQDFSWDKSAGRYLDIYKK